MNIIPDPRVLIVQAGGFLLVLLVFKMFLFKPIMQMLDARRNEVEGHYADAESQRRMAEEMKAEYERHLAKVAEEMRAKITEAVKEGQTMREEIIADSRSQAERILTKAQEEISREKDTAMAELKAKVADLAIGAASKLIDESLDTPKHKQLVGKFIDDLEGVSR